LDKYVELAAKLNITYDDHYKENIIGTKKFIEILEFTIDNKLDFDEFKIRYKFKNMAIVKSQVSVVYVMRKGKSFSMLAVR